MVRSAAKTAVPRTSRGVRCAISAVAVLCACSRQPGAGAPWLTAPSRDAHDAMFPIASGTHAVDCNSCHGASDSFSNFDCLGCHTQAPTGLLHRGQGGYQWASASCYACHPRGTVTAVPENHAQFFPIDAAGSHAYGKAVTVAGTPRSIACGACHVDAANRPDVDCTGCHIQSGGGTPSGSVPADQTVAHAGKVSTTPRNLWLGTGSVGTGSGASAGCLRCHAADAQRRGFVATHGLAGPAAAVFDISATNRNHFVSCEQCHTAITTGGGRQNPELDFARASCDACHAPAATVADHASFGVAITGYASGDPNNSTACLGCHATGGPASSFTHAWFPIGASHAHNSAVARCSDCHADTSTYSGDPAANLARIDCKGCHSDALEKHSTPAVGRTIWDVPGGASYTDNALCLKCHAGNIGGAVAAFSTPLVFRLAQHDIHCSMSDKTIGSLSAHSVDRNADDGVNICFACHDAVSAGSATPWAANWSVASPATSCTACHEHQTNPAPAVTCR